MVSSAKIVGYTLQIIGMLVMFFGFFQLVLSVQKTVGYAIESVHAQTESYSSKATNKTCSPGDDFCGVDITKEGAMEQVFSKKVNNFIIFLGAGIALVILGLLIRAGDEIGGFIGKMKGDREQVRIPVGKLRWSDSFR